MERLIKFAYKKWKSGFPGLKEPHPDEEDIACFFEGRLSEKENEHIKEHLISCSSCAEIIAVQAKIKTSEMEAPSKELLSAVRNLADTEDKPRIMEIILKFKQKLVEIVNTNGDILVGQELVPAPVLRSRQIKDFKDEVTILKDFKSARVEVKIKNKDEKTFDLSVLVKEKQTNRAIRGLRVTLIKDNLELESYLADSCSVTFEHVLLGRYIIEVAATETKLATIMLDVKK